MVDRARRHHIAACLALLATLAGCIGNYQTADKISLKSDEPVGLLILENYLGDCTIRADPAAHGVRAEVEMIGRARSQADADAARAEMTASLVSKPASRPPTVVAMMDHPGNNHWFQHESRWTITVPPDIAVRAKNVVGALNVEGIRRGAYLQTGAGTIKVRDLLGGLTLVVEDGGADVEAAGRIEIRVDAGDARVGPLAQNPADVAVRVRAGKITLDLPPDRSGTLSAESTFGKVRLNAPGIELNRSLNEDRHIECELNGRSKPRIDLISELGDINIEVSGQSDVPQKR